jgi:ABC-type multidrug transport system fused ATPase/permease subunit
VKRKFFLRYYVDSLKRVLNLLDKRDQRKLVMVAVIQVFLGILDLIGVALVGLLTTLAVRGIQLQKSGNRLQFLLEVLRIENLDLKFQIYILGLMTVLIFVLKTIFSVYFLRKTIFYLSRKSADISSLLLSKLLNQPLDIISAESMQQRLFSLTIGVSNLTVGVLTSAVLFIADSALLLVLSVGLFFVDPIICFLTLFLFLTIGLSLFYFTHARASHFGALNSRVSIESNQQIVEAISSYRELRVKGSREFYANRIRLNRLRMSAFDAELKFLPSISKYVADLTIVVGALLISGVLLSRGDYNYSIGVLAVFLASSTRIAPAVMRLQQSAITIKSYLAYSESTLNLADQLASGVELSRDENPFQVVHLGFEPQIEVQNVSFTYSSAQKITLKNISLNIKEGEFVALVGPSGGGKSTLIDLILGIINSSTGNILLSKVDNKKALQNWPGAIAYVPQNVFISNTTIRDNICLGFDSRLIDESLIWEAIDTAELGAFVRALPNQLDFSVGDSGTFLSGGERQRLGLARALLTKPRLVVLDEATSSLDSETENSITEAILRLRGNCTVLLVAHRLSTVRSADQIFYIENGEIVTSGTFDQVKSLNKNFERQAQYMGL